MLFGKVVSVTVLLVYVLSFSVGFCVCTLREYAELFEATRFMMETLQMLQDNMKDVIPAKRYFQQKIFIDVHRFYMEGTVHGQSRRVNLEMITKEVDTTRENPTKHFGCISSRNL